MQIQVNGVQEAIAKLGIKDKHIRKALRQGCRNACKGLAKLVKKNEPEVTGQTRANIKVRALPRSRKWIGARVVIDNTFNYAGFPELGTKGRQTTKGLVGAIKGKHTMKNSANEGTPEAVTEIENAFKGVI